MSGWREWVSGSGFLQPGVAIPCGFVLKMNSVVTRCERSEVNVLLESWDIHSFDARRLRIFFCLKVEKKTEIKYIKWMSVFIKFKDNNYNYLYKSFHFIPVFWRQRCRRHPRAARQHGTTPSSFSSSSLSPNPWRSLQSCPTIVLQVTSADLMSPRRKTWKILQFVLGFSGL